MKKTLFALVLMTLLIAEGNCFAQTAANPSAFPSTSVNFNLTPITLPGAKTSVAGAETDVLRKSIGSTKSLPGVMKENI